MPVSLDLAKALDKAYEDKSLDELLASPPSALARLTAADDQVLAETFNIRTARDLGTNKYFALAGSLVALANKL